MIRIQAEKYANAIVIWIPPLEYPGSLFFRKFKAGVDDETHEIETDQCNITFDLDVNGMINYMYIHGPNKTDIKEIEDMKSIMPCAMYNVLRIFYDKNKL